MNTCRAKGCRFSNTHVTLGHRCGVCNAFGHGEMECGTKNKIDTLRELSRNDKIPENLQCNVPNCIYKWSHIKSAHHCRTCSERGHGTSNCPQSIGQHETSRRSSSIFLRWEIDSQLLAGSDEKDEKDEKDETDYKVKCPRCRKYNTFPTKSRVYVDSECDVCKDNKAQVLFPVCFHICVCEKCCDRMNENKSEVKSSAYAQSGFFPADDRGSQQAAFSKMGLADGKVYVTIPAGMGCSFWYRRTSRDALLEKLFMHSDDWGQYGPGRVSEHTSFIDGYTEIQ